MDSHNEEGRASIHVSHQTKDALVSMKHAGQTYDRLIQELIRFWRDKRSEYWTRRQIAAQREKERARIPLNAGNKGASTFKQEERS